MPNDPNINPVNPATPKPSFVVDSPPAAPSTAAENAPVSTENVETPPPPIVSQEEPSQNSTNNYGLPPVVTTPMPKGKSKKGLVAAILGILILVGGLGAGLFLVQRQQLFKQKAAGDPPPPFINCESGTECHPDHEAQYCDDNDQMCTYKIGECGFGPIASCNYLASDHGVSICNANCPAGVNCNGRFYCIPDKWCIANPNCEYGDSYDCHDDPDCQNVTPPPPPPPTVTPTPTPTPTPSPTGVPLTCGSECIPNPSNDPCPGSLTCEFMGLPNISACQNPQCLFDSGKDPDSNCICSSTPSPTPTASPPGYTPTPTPTLPPTGYFQCLNLKAYNTSWTLLTLADLAKLKVGDKVRFTVTGDSSYGNITKAKFSVNRICSPEILMDHIKPGPLVCPTCSLEFYYEYTIPAGVTSFVVDARLYVEGRGWMGKPEIGLDVITCLDEPVSPIDG